MFFQVISATKERAHAVVSRLPPQEWKMLQCLHLWDNDYIKAYQGKR